jgi:hypothetical protein
MNFKINFYAKIIMPVIFLSTGISVMAKSKIQNLTSNETASKVAAKLSASSGLHKHSLGI